MFDGSHFRERVDIVGLFCLEYTVEERLPRLKPSAENNSLFLYKVDGTLGPHRTEFFSENLDLFNWLWN